MLWITRRLPIDYPLIIVKWSNSQMIPKFSINICEHFCSNKFVPRGVRLTKLFQHILRGSTFSLPVLFCYGRLAWSGDETWKRTSLQCYAVSKVSRWTSVFSLQDHNTVQKTGDENKETHQLEDTPMMCGWTSLSWHLVTQTFSKSFAIVSGPVAKVLSSTLLSLHPGFWHKPGNCHGKELFLKSCSFISSQGI